MNSEHVQQVSAQDGGTRHETLEALKRADDELKHKIAGLDDLATTELSMAAEIRSFIAKVQATGRLLIDPSERKEAQSILDYWSARLVTLSDVWAADFMPAVLDRADRIEAKPSDHSREIIRLGAAARLWRDSGQKPGYLLFGDAIERAAKFHDQDPDIAEFVDASAKRRRESRNRWLLAGAGALISAAVIFIVLFYVLPGWATSLVKKINDPKATNDEKGQDLRWLQRLQPYLPSSKSIFDFSGVELVGIQVPGLRLQSPKFVQASITGVNFEKAQMPDASFSDSKIASTKFSNADLGFGQFVNAAITDTSFNDAGLWRAIFDGANLCHVEFQGADLRNTSFRGVTLEEGFTRYFKGAAWWLADGWNSHQLHVLAQQGNEAPVKSSAFQKLFQYNVERLEKAPIGSFERAAALNNMAWIEATYGLDLGEDSPDMTAEQCLAAANVPGNALEAARQAVCIVEEVSKKASAYKSSEANFEDTLGYVLMQTASSVPAREAVRLQEAVGRLKIAVDILNEDSSPHGAVKRPLNYGEIMFRYAVAKFAVGSKDEAKSALMVSMDKEGYLPRHELRRLNRYITGEFENELYARIDRRFPTPEAPPICATK